MTGQTRHSAVYRLLPWLLAVNAVLWSINAHNGGSVVKWIAAVGAVVAFVFCVAGRMVRR